MMRSFTWVVTFLALATTFTSVGATKQAPIPTEQRVLQLKYYDCESVR